MIPKGFKEDLWISQASFCKFAYSDASIGRYLFSPSHCSDVSMSIAATNRNADSGLGNMLAILVR
jgi:hypothetical protein